MVRAVDGMIKEKDAIFLSLIVSVLLFQMETLAAGFLVMEQNAAIACYFILFIGTYYWYKYCSRIYYRFKVCANIYFLKSWNFIFSNLILIMVDDLDS